MHALLLHHVCMTAWQTGSMSQTSMTCLSMAERSLEMPAHQSESVMACLQVDGSTEYEYTQEPTNAALPLANPQNFGPTYTAQELQAFVYNVLTEDNSQQGSALPTLQKLIDDSADRSLFLLNGDVSYAR